MHKHLYGGIKLATCLKRLHNVYERTTVIQLFAAVWTVQFCFCVDGSLLYGWFVVVWMVRRCLDGAANCCCKRSYSHNFQPWKKLTCSWTNFWICSGWLVTDTDHGDIGRRLGGLHSAPSYHILRPTSTAVKTLEVCQNGFHYHSTVVAMAKPNPRCKTRSDLFPAV